jgi:hypothetical protein
MFNWFKKSPLYQTTATDDMLLGDLPRHEPPKADLNSAPNWHSVPKPKPWPAPPAIEPGVPPFLIGMTLDGKTQFRLTQDYTTITMTMTQQGVIDLIEDLAHTIRKDYSVVIIPEDEA